MCLVIIAIDILHRHIYETDIVFDACIVMLQKLDTDTE